MRDDVAHGHHRALGASQGNVRLARNLRKDMSLPEVLLWRELRGKPMGMKFRRQYPALGYVADFACVEARLLVEVDGIAHDMGERPETDARRGAVLAAKGWRVIRVPAKDVLADVVAVAASIVSFAEGLRPLPPARYGEELE